MIRGMILGALRLLKFWPLQNMVSNPKRINSHLQNAGAQTKKRPIKNSPINIPQTLSGMLSTSVDNPTILSIKNIHMIQQALMKRIAGDTQSQKKTISSNIIPNHLTQTWSWWIDYSNIPIYIYTQTIFPLIWNIQSPMPSANLTQLWKIVTYR